MKHGGAVLGLLSLLGYMAAGGSCSTATEPYEDVEQWLCFEDAKSCQCFGIAADATVVDERPKTTSCSAERDCCFVKEQKDGTYSCSCIPTPPETADSGAAGASGASGEGREGGAGSDTTPASRCVIAAANLGSVNVVAHCPPVKLDSAAVCAFASESCEPDYLKKNGLIACCDGLACRANATGQSVCISL